jgi:regulation of enolase protein 1 (concanavalin A-like superfamily)
LKISTTKRFDNHHHLPLLLFPTDAATRTNQDFISLPLLNMTEESFAPTNGFGDIVDAASSDQPNGLHWFCPPETWKDEEFDDETKKGWWKVEGSQLYLAPPAKKDFWRKTYYQPLLVKDDAPFLYRKIPMKNLPVTVETSFSLSAKSQFDQAGIMIRLDYEHWVKTGIEVVDGVPRLSCVVTNTFSDWSTQQVENSQMKIRVHVLPQHGGSIVVEAAPLGSEEWAFIRIAHLNKDMRHDLLNDDPTVKKAFQGDDAPKDSIMVGIFGACPVDQNGMVVAFQDFSITEGSAFVHDA